MKYEILRQVVYRTLYKNGDKPLTLNELNRFFTMANEIERDYDHSLTFEQNIEKGMQNYFKQF